MPFDEPEAKRARIDGKSSSGALAGFASGAAGPGLLPQQAAYQRLAAAAAARLSDVPRPRVYVGNLDACVGEQEILMIFSEFGTVTGIDMPREGLPPQPKGFCFVEYAEQRMADRAIGALGDFVLGGRRLRVGQPAAQRRTPAPPLSAGAPPLSSAPLPLAQAEAPARQGLEVLLLENLVAPGEADEDLPEEVREECGRFGAVRDVRVREVGAARHVRVFVRFEDAAGGARAAAAMHGRWFGKRRVRARAYDREAFAAGDLDKT